MVVLACCVCTHHQYSRGVAANVFHPCGRIFEDVRETFQNEAVQQYKQAVVVIETENSKGTGFSFNERGDILTNYHVVKGEHTVTVAFPDLGLFQGEVTHTFPDVDLAVVNINETEMPHLKLADSFYADYGDPIYFIGNPLSFNGIANQGTVIDWTYVASKDEPVVMLDAPVYRGNSGSPVIDLHGNVIGVIFATMYHDAYGRVGLFVPIDYFHQRYRENERMITKRKFPWFGKQLWEDIFFVHWRVPPDSLKPYVPKPFELDLFDGAAWISAVCFQAKKNRVRHIPLDLMRPGYQLNVRTYVDVAEKQEKGVYFFRLVPQQKSSDNRSEGRFSAAFYICRNFI